MLALTLMLILAINGGVFVGTIFYSAWQTAKLDQLFGYAQKLWQMPYL